MPLTLQEAREVVTDSVLHIGDTTFYADKIDRAIKVSCERFLRETGIARTVGTVTVNSAASTIDVPATVTDFLPGCLVELPFIAATNSRLQVVSYQNLVTQRDQMEGATGRPELIAWNSPTAGYLFPTTNAQYIISFVYVQPLISFTPGTKTRVVLNIPDRYVYEVLWTGAKAALVRGAPGHPDWKDAQVEFEALIARAKGEVTPRGVWFSDLHGDFDHVYHYGGFV
jgi:hypothetical protein